MKHLQHMTGVKVRFLGATDHLPARWAFSWQDWPGDNGRKVTRYLSFDYEHGLDNDWIAEQAARLYCEWISKGSSCHKGTKTAPATVCFIHSADPDFDIVGITTKYAEE